MRELRVVERENTHRGSKNKGSLILFLKYSPYEAPNDEGLTRQAVEAELKEVQTVENTKCSKISLAIIIGCLFFTFLHVSLHCDVLNKALTHSTQII